MLPALALAALVVLTAAMSRQLGANRSGQILAALATATCGEYLGAMHELTTTTPNFVFWAVTLLLVMRLLASQNPRWWLAIGGCIGVGSEAEWNIGFLAAALAVGFLVTGQRTLLRSRYLLLGCVLAAALAAPDVIWRAAHGWPQLDVFRALQGQAGHNRATSWIAQILYAGPALTPIWVTGVIWSLRSPAARPFRPVALATVIVIMAQFVLGGDPFYPGAAYTFLFAAGSVSGRALAGGAPVRAGRVWPFAVILAAAAVGYRSRCRSCRPGRCTRCRCRRSTTTSARRSAEQAQVALVGRLYGSLRPRNGRTPRFSPGTTAKPGPSTGTGGSSGCPGCTAGRTPSGCGGHHRRGHVGPGRQRRSGPAAPRVRARPAGRHVPQRARRRR